MREWLFAEDEGIDRALQRVYDCPLRHWYVLLDGEVRVRKMVTDQVHGEGLAGFRLFHRRWVCKKRRVGVWRILGRV